MSMSHENNTWLWELIEFIKWNAIIEEKAIFKTVITVINILIFMTLK